MDNGIDTITLKDSDELLNDIEHHFKLIAGPGAGKTRWLTNHIKNVLHNSKRLKKCRKIASITYTNVGVNTIRERLGEVSEHVEVATIHSFLYKHIVKPYIFLLADEYNINVALIDGHDEHIVRIKKVKEWISNNIRQLRYLYKDLDLTKQHLANLSWYYEEDDCLLKVRDHKDYNKRFKLDDGSQLPFILDYKKHQQIYFQYKQTYWGDGIIDHEDVLFFSFQLINRFEEVRRILRSKFPYFFLDEFQDTHPIQTSIIYRLAEDETIIGVIGDDAQSIYGFQGADLEQFRNFSLPSIKIYKIENNHRSTNDIIKVLNHMRDDLVQKNIEDKTGRRPTLVIGEIPRTIKRVEKLVNNDLFSLSYANVTANEMKYGINRPTGGGIYDIFNDSNYSRMKLMIAAINAVEYARYNQFRDSIKSLSNRLKIQDKFKRNSLALSIVKALLNEYNSFRSVKLISFYNIFKDTYEKYSIDKVPSLRNNTKPYEFYNSITYKEVALYVRFNEEESRHRTIHKSKGENLKNVLVVVRGKFGREFDETDDLSFLLVPNLNDENHRVYYVAMSRAEENLFINVPSLTDGSKEKLREIGFDIMDIGQTG